MKSTLRIKSNLSKDEVGSRNRAALAQLKADLGGYVEVTADKPLPEGARLVVYERGGAAALVTKKPVFSAGKFIGLMIDGVSIIKRAVEKAAVPQAKQQGTPTASRRAPSKLRDELTQARVRLGEHRRQQASAAPAVDHRSATFIAPESLRHTQEKQARAQQMAWARRKAAAQAVA